MDLTFQVSKQYCSLQHQTLLSLLEISTTERHFCSDTATSFFLKPFVNCLPLFTGITLDTFWSGGLIFQFHIFLSFYTVHGVPVARILEWFFYSLPQWTYFDRILTMTHPSWVALQGTAHSFIELHKSPFTTTRLWSMKEHITIPLSNISSPVASTANDTFHFHNPFQVPIIMCTTTTAFLTDFPASSPIYLSQRRHRIRSV